MKKYTVEIEQTGDILEEYATLEEAEKKLKEYENEDKKENNYEDGFYSIYEVDNEADTRERIY